jgi:excisionase family DNA binding protein
MRNGVADLRSNRRQRAASQRKRLEERVPAFDVSDERPLDALEVANLLGLHRLSVYAAARRGELPSFRVGRRVFFPREAIRRLLSGQDRSGSAA